MKLFHVITPEYCTYEGGAYEPPEYRYDVIEIEAATKRDAIRLGVVEMLKEGRNGYRWYRYCARQRRDGECPYTGVWAEEITEEMRREPGAEVV